MSGAKPFFVRYVAKDFLDGTQTLLPLEELAYRRICDLLYVHAGNVPDDDSLAWATKTGEHWPAVRDALIAKRKIRVIRGKVVVNRCRIEIDRAKRLQKCVKNASKMGVNARKTGAQKPKKPNTRNPNKNKHIQPDGLPNGPPSDEPSGQPSGQPNGQQSQSQSSSSKPQPTALNPARADPAATAGNALLDLLAEVDPAWETRPYGIVRQWVADGADYDRHMLPAIEAAIASGAAKRARSLGYFTGMVMDRVKADPGVDPDHDRPFARARRLAAERGDGKADARIVAAYTEGGVDAADAAGKAYLEKQNAEA